MKETRIHICAHQCETCIASFMTTVNGELADSDEVHALVRRTLSCMSKFYGFAEDADTCYFKVAHIGTDENGEVDLIVYATQIRLSTLVAERNVVTVQVRKSVLENA